MLPWRTSSHVWRVGVFRDARPDDVRHLRLNSPGSTRFRSMTWTSSGRAHRSHDRSYQRPTATAVLIHRRDGRRGARLPMRICVQVSVGGKGSAVARPCAWLSEAKRGSGGSVGCGDLCHHGTLCVQRLDSAVIGTDSAADDRVWRGQLKLAPEKFWLRACDDANWCGMVRRRSVVVPRRDRNGERRERTLNRFRFPSIARRMLRSRTALSFRQGWREGSSG